MKNGVYQYPIKIALLSGIVGFIIIQIAFKFIKNRLTKDGMYCKVKIIIKNNDTDINCLVDSGNLLKDPIMNLSVIVVEKEKLREILPSEILDNIVLIKKEGDLKCENNLINEYITRIRLVPFFKNLLSLLAGWILCWSNLFFVYVYYVILFLI